MQIRDLLNELNLGQAVQLKRFNICNQRRGVRVVVTPQMAGDAAQGGKGAGLATAVGGVPPWRQKPVELILLLYGIFYLYHQKYCFGKILCWFDQQYRK